MGCEMKSIKKYIIFYSIICILFFIIELLLYALNKWAQGHSLGAEMVTGLFVPFMFIIFCCIGLSSFFVGYFSITKYYWKAYIPFLIVAGTVLLYVIIPKTEYSIWYKVIKLYV